jgi:hypothetical protein
VLGDPVLVRRLEALVAQRAVPGHTHARIAVEPHALVVAAVALSGEDASIHAIRLGWAGRTRSQFHAIPDPRRREDMDAMFAWLGDYLRRYFDWCEKRGLFPQLVITSPAALRHLTNIADDYRFLERNPAVARTATLLTYFTERAQVAGQQAVAVMTEVLTTHWVTPMQPSQEQHLGAVLACIDPPPGADLAQRIREAERVPMGFTTDPAFDNTILQPLLARYHRARKRAPERGDPPEAVRAIEPEITAALEPVVTRMYDAIQQGIRLLRAADHPPLPAVAEWRREEASAFAHFRLAMAKGVRFPLHDRAKLAAFRLVQREDAQANQEAAVECDDRFGRARGICTGQALAGHVENRRVERRPGRGAPVHTFEVVSTQEGLTLRERDELRWADDPRLAVVVSDYRLDGGRTRVTVTVTAGMNVPGVPSEGTPVTFVRAVPDWHRLGRRRAAMSDRLSTLPWTHIPGARPARRPREAAPADPLRSLEMFR